MEKRTITIPVPVLPSNWKTTAGGALSAAGFLLANKAAFLATHPDKLHCGALLVVAVAMFVTGALAHDAGTPSQSTLDEVEAMMARLLAQVAPPAAPPDAPPSIIVP